MSPFIESLRRLYLAGKVAPEKVQALRDEGKITQEEYDYVTGSA